MGLDRSDAGAATQVLAFQRAGKKIYANLENHAFQAAHGSANEVRAVRDSFAVSTIWSSEVVAEDAAGMVLVDISSFLTRDGFGVADRLKEAKQGSLKVEAALSYPDVGDTQSFPENLEFEAHQTFVSDAPGPEVFGKSETPVFDLSTAAQAAADITFGDLLNVARLNRVADMGARDPGQLSLAELLTKTTAAVFPAREGDGRTALIRRRV